VRRAVLAIITTAEYKAYAGISGTAQDAQLDILIPGLQAELERRTGRKFDSATYTEYVDGSDSPQISVRNYPITSVTSVQLIDRSETVVYTYDAAYYKIELDTGLISRQSGGMWGGEVSDAYPNWWQPLPSPLTYQLGPAFPDGWRNIKVIYVGGYASNAMPADLKLLMYDLTSTRLAQIGQDMGLESEGLGHYNYKRGQNAADIWEIYATRVAMWRRCYT